MGKLQNFWTGISNIGVTPRMDIQAEKRIKITNQLAVSIAIIAFNYIFLFWFLGFKTLGLLVGICVTLYLATLLLNHLKKPLFASIWLITIWNVAIAFYSVNFGKATGIHLICIVNICLPWIFFQLKHWKYIILGTIICIATFAYLDFNDGIALVAITPDIQKIIYVTVVYAVLGPILSLSFYNFLAQNKKAEDKLQLSNNEIEAKNHTLMQAQIT